MCSRDSQDSKACPWTPLTSKKWRCSGHLLSLDLPCKPCQAVSPQICRCCDKATLKAYTQEWLTFHRDPKIPGRTSTQTSPLGHKATSGKHQLKHAFHLGSACPAYTVTLQLSIVHTVIHVTHEDEVGDLTVLHVAQSSLASYSRCHCSETPLVSASAFTEVKRIMKVKDTGKASLHFQEASSGSFCLEPVRTQLAGTLHSNNLCLVNKQRKGASPGHRPPWPLALVTSPPSCFHRKRGGGGAQPVSPCQYSPGSWVLQGKWKMPHAMSSPSPSSHHPGTTQGLHRGDCYGSNSYGVVQPALLAKLWSCS